MDETNKIIKLEVNGEPYFITPFEFANWLSLMEAVQTVGAKADELKIPPKSMKWVKPGAFNTYIQTRRPSVIKDITMSLTGENEEIEYGIPLDDVI